MEATKKPATSLVAYPCYEASDRKIPVLLAHGIDHRLAKLGPINTLVVHGSLPSYLEIAGLKELIAALPAGPVEVAYLSIDNPPTYFKAWIKQPTPKLARLVALELVVSGDIPPSDQPVQQKKASHHGSEE